MDLQFLDICDLNDEDKTKLLTILKSDVLKLPPIWDTESNDTSTAVTEEITTEDLHWYNAMTPPFPRPLISCNEWAAPLYNISTNGHMPPLVPGIYSHPGYLDTKVQENMIYGMENGRRNCGKDIRRDHFNRAMNPANEVQSGYTGDQAHFHAQIPIMYIYPEHLSASTQHHQVTTGQIYYPPPMYSSIVHPQPISSNAQTHPTYPPNHQLPSMVNGCVQQSQHVPSQQSTQELTVMKSPEKRTIYKQVQSTCAPYKPCDRQVNENEDPSLVISDTYVNNATLKSVKKVDGNTANINNATSSEKIDGKVQHTIVCADINENCNGTEKVEVVHVNTDLGTNLETSQNEETNKKFENEIESSVTTDVKISPKPISSVDKSKLLTKVQIDIASKSAQDNITSETPNGSLATPSSSPGTPNALSPVSVASPPATTVRSYASILRKDSIDTTLPKPTADKVDRIIEEIERSPKSEKVPTSPNFTPENQNSTVNAENNSKILQNGILQNCYDDPNTFRMGEFLSGYQMDKQTVSLLPRGLTNRSNYCYINSILQALLACPPFYNLLKALPLPKSRGKNSPTPLIDNMVRFVREFSPLTEAARMPRKDRKDHNKRGEDTALDIYSGVAFEPSYVYAMLKNTSAAGAFSVEGRQEDAEECLSCLLNGINDEMLELMKLVADQNAVANADINVDHDEEEWQVMGPKNKGAVTRCTEFGRTPLSDIFRGQLRSRVSRAGEQPTDNVQPFFTLQLDVQKAESVKNALEILVGKDQVEGMTCSKTRQQIEAWKQVTLEELPVILILHLKWFVYKFDKYSNGCSKILKSMEFPIDLKIDGKFLSPNTVKKLNIKQKQYKLFAVTYHDGKEATKGHYFTDAFHVGYGSWVRYDDSTVKSVTESNVLRPTSPRVPYLLYYRRCDTIGNNQTNSAKAH